MRELFDVRELVKIGVDDEIAGVAFYSVLAAKARSSQLRKLFADLAEQERYHRIRFEEILETMGGLTTREDYPGEYVQYLRALTGMRAFPDPESATAMAQACADDAAAVELATRFERDTLVLMGEMKTLVPAADQDVVNELAREEQQHLVMLAQARELADRS